MSSRNQSHLTKTHHRRSQHQKPTTPEPWPHNPSTPTAPCSAQYSDYAQTAPDDGNGCEQAAAVGNKQVARGEAHGKRVVIDARKSLLACVSEGELGVWDISTPTPMPVAATILPDNVWARSCAFTGLSRLIFGTLDAGYRIYDYLLDKWQTGNIAPNQRY
jgi:hypothetical protein